MAAILPRFGSLRGNRGKLIGLRSGKCDLSYALIITIWDKESSVNGVAKMAAAGWERRPSGGGETQGMREEKRATLTKASWKGSTDARTKSREGGCTRGKKKRNLLRFGT